MFIKLTRKFKKLTPEAKERVKEYQQKFMNTLLGKSKEDMDENGLSIEWYKEQNLKPPTHLDEDNENGIVMDLEKDSIDAKAEYLCNVDAVEDFEATEHGTLITYGGDKEVLVEEDLETIIKMIRNG